MSSQIFLIRSIPDIFPSLDFLSEVVFNSELIEQPTNLTIAKTEGVWATCKDNIKTNRKIQTYIEKNYKLVAYTHQSVDYWEIEAADEVEILTDDDRILTAYNVNVEYEEITAQVWRIVITFNLHEPVQTANHLESTRVEQDDHKNYLSVLCNYPVYEYNGAILFNGVDGNDFIFPNENEFAFIEVGNRFYWHSDIREFNESKEDCFEAVCTAKSSTGVTISLKNNLGKDRLSGRIILNNFEGVNSVATAFNPINYKIYTYLQPKFTFETQTSELSETEEIIQTFDKIIQKEYLNVNFYISEENRWLLRYLNFASTLNFYDSKNDVIYNILQVPNCYEIADRDDLIELFEVKFKGLVSNLVSKQNF